MKRRTFLAGSVALSVAGAGAAQAETMGAAETIAAASAQAAAEDRRLLLIFHADWCTYCHLFDQLLADSQAAAIVERSYAPFHLRVLEREPEKRELQLPGSDDVFHSYATGMAGLPYMAILNADASKLCDSIMDSNGVNFGFPVTPEELDGFEIMMRAGAPGMTKQESRTLRETCVRIMDV